MHGRRRTGLDGLRLRDAVRVTAKLETKFCDITPEGPTPRTKPTAVQTLLLARLDPQLFGSADKGRPFTIDRLT
jgi:hypothetical protein